MNVTLDGHSLTIEQLTHVARDPLIKVEVEPVSWRRVEACRKVIDDVVTSYKNASPRERSRFAVYGVTTGFGEFKNISLEPEQLITLQERILLSHSVGCGENEDIDDPSNYFAADIVRAALVQRINTFLQGHSGVRRELVELLLRMVNHGIVPLVPTRGSVGSSGDLCPLAHTFVTLLGHGRYLVVKTRDDVNRGMRGCKPHAATGLLHHLKRPKFRLAEKEGLGLTNGAVFSAAMLALSVYDAEMLAGTADVAAALTLEAICGRVRSFHPKVHAARKIDGQITSAKNILALVDGSQLVGLTSDVQDAYSVRCAPQVHGASREAISFARRIALAEINAATDNPLFFEDVTPSDSGNENDPQRAHEPRAFSAGNFHGQPVGMAADFLAIGVAELACISERRAQMLLDAHHNRGLPGNLVAHAGVNSGYMILQYTAASLVSENKVLCHPSSVDSIPTSANVEDHVAMATTAARKIRQILNNVRGVLAIELMVGAQAVEWRVCDSGNNVEIAARLKSPQPTVVDKEAHVNDRAAKFKRRFQSPTASGRKDVAAMLGVGTKKLYSLVRKRVPPMIDDCYLEPSFRAARELVAAEEVRKLLALPE